MMTRKPIQLTTTGKGALVALCNDGAMFRLASEGWVDLPAIPQPEKPVKQTRKHSTEDMYSLHFESWWGHYPRKTAKKKAYESWVSQHCESKAVDLIRSLQNQLKANLWDDLQFTPHPATYINQHRWEDEAVTVSDEGKVQHWTDTWSGILSKAEEMGIERERGESDPDYKNRIVALAAKAGIIALKFSAPREI